jgi:hypothetical protein
MITQEQLKECLHYNPGTGDFTWIVRRGARAKAGDLAGGSRNDGYKSIQIYGEKNQFHRLAFLYMEGEMPKHHVDHINHIRDDNRWLNLRHATESINSKNKSMYKKNTSGVAGVSWRKSVSKWAVEIKADGKRHYLGCHAEWWDAVCLRKSANNRYGYHKNHGVEA